MPRPGGNIPQALSAPRIPTANRFEAAVFVFDAFSSRLSSAVGCPPGNDQTPGSRISVALRRCELARAYGGRSGGWVQGAVGEGGGEECVSVIAVNNIRTKYYKAYDMLPRLGQK
jgi:hypothetical protein